VSEAEERLAEDKALRDAALRLFKSDLALIRGDLDERGIGARVKDRLGGAALGMVDDAVDYARDHKGWIAAGVAATALWLARRPLLEWLADCLDGGETDPAEPDDAAGRSDAEPELTGDIR
jgi:hypothetical protein